MAWVAQIILTTKSIIYKVKMDKFDVIKIKNFLSSKDKEWKGKPPLGENIFKNIYLIKDLCQGDIISSQNTNIKRIKFFQYKIGKKI